MHLVYREMTACAKRSAKKSAQQQLGLCGHIEMSHEVEANGWRHMKRDCMEKFYVYCLMIHSQNTHIYKCGGARYIPL